MTERGEDSDSNAPDDPIPPPRESRGPLVTFGVLSAVEAQLAAAKLQAEGIDAFVAGEAINVMNPLAFPNVDLQVHEGDLMRAREILTQPPAEMEGEYVDEEFRCPACHRKTIDLVPLSPRQKVLRLGCFTVFAVPIALGAAAWAMNDPSLTNWPPAVAPPWFLAMILLPLLLVWQRRKKRCRACGQEW